MMRTALRLLVQTTGGIGLRRSGRRVGEKIRGRGIRENVLLTTNLLWVYTNDRYI
jgi:hypothetical protein